MLVIRFQCPISKCNTEFLGILYFIFKRHLAIWSEVTLTNGIIIKAWQDNHNPFVIAKAKL